MWFFYKVQQAGWSSVCCPVGDGEVAVGLRAPVVSEGSPHSGTGEQRCQPHVQRRSEDEYAQSGKADLDPVQESGSGLPTARKPTIAL